MALAKKMSCSALHKTRKVQNILNKAWKEQSAEVIKNTGTLANFQWKDFKKGFKKGFMQRCKSRKAALRQLKLPASPDNK